MIKIEYLYAWYAIQFMILNYRKNKITQKLAQKFGISLKV